jgi:tRNA A-37 threonylcarbamoyl transferase component Bud32
VPRTCPQCNETYDGTEHVCPNAGPGTVRLRKPQSSDPTDALIGRRVGGFVIERVIGEGGMGVVYLGTHPVLGRRVAVKVIRSDLAADEDVRRRFMDEARVLAALEDPHIVEIQDLSLLSDGRAYLVMELVEGELLSKRLRQGPIPVAEAIDIARGVLDGLAAAHARGILHRDIKPSNIALSDKPPRVKLLDFGIAKLRDRAVAGHTRTGAMVGTPGYMAPEQAGARADVGPAADVYAVGVVLYEMLAGHRPFEPPSTGEFDWVDVLVRQRTEKPGPLKATPDWLEGVVLRALAPDPAKRFASAGEMSAALARTAESNQARRLLPRLFVVLVSLVAVSVGVGFWRVRAARDVQMNFDAAERPVIASVAVRDADAIPDASPVIDARPDAAVRLAAVTHPHVEQKRPQPPPDAGLVVSDAPTPTSTPDARIMPVDASMPADAPAHEERRIDPLAYLPTALAAARRVYADVELTGLEIVVPAIDGTVDIAGRGQIHYEFRSPSHSTAPDDGRFHTKMCYVVVKVSSRGVETSQPGGNKCDDVPIVPRCRPAVVVRQANSTLGELPRSIRLRVPSTGAGQSWKVSSGWGNPFEISDDCR